MRGVMKTAQEALDCKRAAGINDTLPPLKTTKKTPLLNRLYHSRTSLLHKLVDSAIKVALPGADVQLLVLGAGLDTGYDRSAPTLYLVDFATVLERRSAPPSNVKLIPGDLISAESVMSALLVAGISFSAPTVILAECVLSYIPMDSVQQLLSLLTHRFANSIMITYDPVLPYGDEHSNAFATKMHSKFTEREAPLLSCAQSLNEYSLRFYSSGFAHVFTTTINQALQLYLSAEERVATAPREPFDEFASLALLQQHYCVTVAGTNRAWFQAVMDDTMNHNDGDGRNDVEVRQRVLLNRIAVAEERLRCIESIRNQSRIQSSSANSSGNTTVAIRRASTADSEALSALYEKAFAPYASQYRSVQKYVKFSLKALKTVEKTYPADSGSALFVAVDKSELLIGSIGVKIKAPRNTDAKGTAEISHFCVDVQHQRRGIGAQLLTQALAQCTEILGRDAEVCLTVLRDLSAARALYEKFGFETVKTEDLGNDCELVFMRRVT